MPYDIALGPSKDRTRLIVHRPDCPVVREQAAEGEPVATLWGCQSIPDELEHHDCMKTRG